MTTTGTIAQVWDREDGVFAVIVRPRLSFEELTLWTRDKWLGALCERYSRPRPRPLLTVQWNEATHEVTAPVLQAKEQSA